MREWLAERALRFAEWFDSARLNTIQADYAKALWHLERMRQARDDLKARLDWNLSEVETLRRGLSMVAAQRDEARKILGRIYRRGPVETAFPKELGVPRHCRWCLQKEDGGGGEIPNECILHDADCPFPFVVPYAQYDAGGGR